jgi:tyrosine-protein phosphatase SIW14
MKRVILTLLLCLTPVLAQVRAVPVPVPVLVQSPDIKNFGVVEEDAIFRGAQPTGRGFYDLQQLGVKTIIDLRGDKTVIGEAVVVHSLGMNFVSFPMKGLSAPSLTDIHKLMALLITLPKPIFIHCQHGEDRTGTVVAVWRMEIDRWTNLAAMAEAKFYHINPIQFGMKHFITNYKPLSALQFDEPVRHGLKSFYQ